MNMDGRREATTFGRGWEKGTETHGFSTESEWTRTGQESNRPTKQRRVGNHYPTADIAATPSPPLIPTTATGSR
jgi:hypothetical protein